MNYHLKEDVSFLHIAISQRHLPKCVLCHCIGVSSGLSAQKAYCQKRPLKNGLEDTEPPTSILEKGIRA